MKIKNLKLKIFATLVLLLVAGGAYFLKIPCVFLTLTSIPCPGCGMTRALISAITLDFSRAFSYHMMFWSVPILYLAMLLDGKLFPKRWANALLYSVIAIGFLINWLFRLF